MPRWQVTDQEVQDLMAYLKTLCGVWLGPAEGLRPGEA